MLLPFLVGLKSMVQKLHLFSYVLISSLIYGKKRPSQMTAALDLIEEVFK
ncbi:hypothetical protein DOT_1097 [Desulfosporosinus sp. OT]|nr:hypothetical protein DOT_1097 [Desulfosporosinus sp. OT]